MRGGAARGESSFFPPKKSFDVNLKSGASKTVKERTDIPTHPLSAKVLSRS